MTERFRKAYDSLVRAYFEGTLAKGTCVACAVGNIIADATGGTIIMQDANDPYCTTKNDFWNVLFASENGRQFTHDVEDGKITHNYTNINVLIPGISVENITKSQKRLFELTGYSAKEMAQIEWAFEENTKLNWYMYPIYQEEVVLEDQYNGLSAVVDVMMDLDHMEIDPKYNTKFREHPKLQIA